MSTPRESLISAPGKVGRWMAASLLGVVLLGCPFARGGNRDAPWLEGPAFSVPAELLIQEALAGEHAEDAAIVYLLHETHIVFDDESRATKTIHQIFLVQTPLGVEGWEEIYGQGKD